MLYDFFLTHDFSNCMFLCLLPLIEGGIIINMIELMNNNVWDGTQCKVVYVLL